MNRFKYSAPRIAPNKNRRISADANVVGLSRRHIRARCEVRHHNFLLSIMPGFVMHMSFTPR
ncbi:hypothetical protein GNZ24_17515 [Burkholderia thailandensis]|nr:hypothetical protein [Burkholderia thailandensis]MUV28782.1 hypothetical protein [Burkholderia thailandensis]NBC92388.1 hypothetical protein [Burkholderia thailandensis]NBD03189.1 hypothetical protein [Burkholderia thailandensis]NBJ18743.1 hypothetical protein [Burkholderia thailandensis]